MSKEKQKVNIHKGDGFPIVAISTARNSKCECGSGKKQKRCCGTSTQFYSTATDRATKKQRGGDYQSKK